MANKPKVTFEQQVAWGRYLYWADLIRMQAEATHEKQDEDSNENIRGSWYAGISFWYSSLHTVVEGWEKVGLADPIIDRLLVHPAGFKKLLRQYRNAVFHYQPKIIEQRLIRFLNHSESFIFWPHVLHFEFVRFFYDWLNGLPGTEEQKAEIRKGIHSIIGGLPQNQEDQLEQILKKAEWIVMQPAADIELQKMAEEIENAARQGRQVLDDAKQGLMMMRMDMLERIFNTPHAQ